MIPVESWNDVCCIESPPATPRTNHENWEVFEQLEDESGQHRDEGLLRSPKVGVLPRSFASESPDRPRPSFSLAEVVNEDNKPTKYETLDENSCVRTPAIYRFFLRLEKGIPLVSDFRPLLFVSGISFRIGSMAANLMFPFWII
eukprot:scaffold135859_cov63-Attheya_sp.AAC.2